MLARVLFRAAAGAIFNSAPAAGPPKTIIIAHNAGELYIKIDRLLPGYGVIVLDPRANVPLYSVRTFSGCFGEQKCAAGKLLLSRLMFIYKGVAILRGPRFSR